MGHYRTGLACLNGHPINASADTSPERNAQFCQDCGEPTIHQCPKCKATIRGEYYVEGVFGLDVWEVTSHCYACGAPYPWTERRTQALFEAIDELDDLSGDERDRLKKSIPDVIVESPRSETAALRFRKVAAKVGAAGGRVLLNVLNSVATDAVKKHLGL